MARIVLTDASPVIGLAIVDGLGWLKPLFGCVRMPPQVRDEVLAGPVQRGKPAIEAALAAGVLAVWPDDVPALELPDLDEGETACIRIARSRPGAALLLIDERAGRAVAAEHGLAVAGTAAVIGLARQRQLIPAARPVFERLHASDFRISVEVIRTVLARVGEEA